MSWYCPECGTEVTAGNECPECNYVDEEPEQDNTATSSSGSTSTFKKAGKIVVYLSLGSILLLMLMVFLIF
jgi:uncharacterized membrane protein YvbJ